MLTVRRVSGGGWPERLDDVQAAVVAHRGGLLRVLGGPGTGKTTLAVEVLAARVRSGEAEADRCLVLTADRRAAGLLRESVTARLGGTSTEPLARTWSSLGFGLLRRARVLRGDPPPRLLSGPEQDVVLKELLAGHAAGERGAPVWPEHLTEALPTRGFRTELRDLLMRAVELDLEPDGLAELGRRHDQPTWVAAAQVLREYDQVTALSDTLAPAYDPAWLLGAAADALDEDPAGLAEVPRELRLLVVDDAHEMTPAAARLLATLTGPGGPDVVLLGDPDTAVQTFRGADPSILGSGWGRLGDGATLVLPTAYRTPTSIHAVAGRVASQIGTVGDARARRSHAATQGGSVEVRLLRTVAQEAASVAATLRAAHLLDGVPWAEMAVLVRGKARTSTLRRVLASEGVPVATTATDVPVRDEVAVRPFLALLGLVCDLQLGRAEGVSADAAADLLMSPVGGADAVGLRRLRRALRTAELAGGGQRTGEELLALSLTQPALLTELGPEARPARRVAAVLRAGRVAAPTVLHDGQPVWAPEVDVERVLWALWTEARLADHWRQTALGGGPAGARADRDLDAVLGLFDAASAYVDRLPGQGPEGFVEQLLSQEVPADTLRPRAPDGGRVALLTPAAAAGRSWRVVVVAGVQEGVWPDLRLRGSVLASTELVDVVLGRAGGVRAAQAAVRSDETRLFLVALTRASERVVVTAVRSEDEQPSPYLDLVDPLGTDENRPFTDPPTSLSLRGLVAAARREAVGNDPAARDEATAALARLAAAGVSGADPASWWALAPLSDDRPRRAPDEEVRVGPSSLEHFVRCELQWALRSVGGDGPALGPRTLGTLVHEVAEHHDGADLLTLRRALDDRWARLGLPPGWLAERTRRDGEAMVARLAAYFDAAREGGWRRLATEASLRLTLGRVVLAGRVDRLEEAPDGEVRVVDYKTGSGKPRRADLPRHPQLGAYQLGVAEGGFADLGPRPATSAHLVQLGKAGGASFGVSPQPPLASDPDPGWVRDLVVASGEAMAGATYRAVPNDRCEICAVRTSCPAQAEGRTV